MPEPHQAGLPHPYPESATPRRPGAKPDRPLSGDPHPYDRLHPQMYAAEFVGTALLVIAGLSVVIALWGKGAPLQGLPISPGARRFLNGVLFGSVGAAIAYSPIGRVSGAHVNPAMSFAFWLHGKLRWRDASCYVVAQLLGAAFGSTVLLLWGNVGASDAWGAAIPAGRLPFLGAVAGEIVCTFLLVFLIFAFAANPATQAFTPLVNPPLFGVLSWLEAPLSGASANPARSFGPELLGADWRGWWVYWIGPAIGAVLAVAVARSSLVRWHPHQARLFHFGHPGGLG